MNELLTISRKQEYMSKEDKRELWNLFANVSRFKKYMSYQNNIHDYKINLSKGRLLLNDMLKSIFLISEFSNIISGEKKDKTKVSLRMKFEEELGLSLGNLGVEKVQLGENYIYSLISEAEELQSIFDLLIIQPISSIHEKNFKEKMCYTLITNTGILAGKSKSSSSTGRKTSGARTNPIHNMVLNSMTQNTFKEDSGDDEDDSDD